MKNLWVWKYPGKYWDQMAGVLVFRPGDEIWGYQSMNLASMINVYRMGVV